MNWFTCKACVSHKAHIVSLEAEIVSLRSQLGHSREREEKAVDQLLNGRGIDPIRPAAKMSMVDSEKATESLFAVFKDEDDNGDGRIQEADNLSDERRPTT